MTQTRLPDQIVAVNDGSTDRSREILESFGDKITLVHIPQATGNKSYAQEFGLAFVTGDVFIATDGDTTLDARFVERVEKDFTDINLFAVGGYVKSVPYNWLTACRAFEYAIGQNLHKLAQDHINFMFVIPGVAGAFRTDIFKSRINFDHDTITEDLDFTYKIHEQGLKILYDRKAICYTQDPSDIVSYLRQMRRWYGGGWQNLLKHLHIAKEPSKALELSLIYIEGLVFGILLFLMPLISLRFSFSLKFFASYFITVFTLAIWATAKERRLDFLYVPFFYLLVVYINTWVFLEQFIKVAIFRKSNLVWSKPKRINNL